MTILYKLTDHNNQTKDDTQWGENVTNTATGYGDTLCSDGLIHAYTHPLLAIMFNPAHADFTNPNLWEAEGEVVINEDGTKVGCKSLTTLRQMPLPVVTTINKIAFGILCIKEVYNDKDWNTWADKWLSGEDRSVATATYAAATTDADAARAAARAAAYAAAYADADAARAAARAAAYAAADAARAAAYAAARAANTVAYVATNKKLDLISLVEKALTID